MIYEFKCTNCEKVFEEIRMLKDDTNEAICPKCNKIDKKIPLTFGFKINGFSSLNGYSWANK